MRSDRGWFLGLAMILTLTVLGIESWASEAIRVYTVKNISTEVENVAGVFRSRDQQTGVIVTGGVPELGFAPFAVGNVDVLICPQDQLDSTKFSAGTDFELANTRVGSYGMAIVVSTTLAVNELTLAEVRKLFTGEHTNWAQLGGPNLPIKVYTREPNAGATVYMKTKLLGEANFAPTATELSLDRAIIGQVSRSAGSVGYVRVNRISGTSLKAIALKNEAKSPAVAPSEENVRNGSYPLTVVLMAHWNGLSKKAASILSFVNMCKEKDLGLH
jgi:phosphate transport system substrate-binding protein